MDYDNAAPWWTEQIELLCGNLAYYDDGPDSIGARCNNCGAVLGSIGMPSRCKTLYAEQEVIDKLKGKK